MQCRNPNRHGGRAQKFACKFAHVPARPEYIRRMGVLLDYVIKAVFRFDEEAVAR